MSKISQVMLYNLGHINNDFFTSSKVSSGSNMQEQRKDDKGFYENFLTYFKK